MRFLTLLLFLTVSAQCLAQGRPAPQDLAETAKQVMRAAHPDIGFIFEDAFFVNAQYKDGQRNKVIVDFLKHDHQHVYRLNRFEMEINADGSWNPCLWTKKDDVGSRVSLEYKSWHNLDKSIPLAISSADEQLARQLFGFFRALRTTNKSRNKVRWDLDQFELGFIQSNLDLDRVEKLGLTRSSDGVVLWIYSRFDQLKDPYGNGQPLSPQDKNISGSGAAMDGLFWQNQNGRYVLTGAARVQSFDVSPEDARKLKQVVNRLCTIEF